MVVMAMCQQSHFREMLGERNATVNLDLAFCGLRRRGSSTWADRQQLLWPISD